MAADVSVIIPTYNRLWALPRAVESCRDECSTEIIVIDDGSTDGTWDWLQTQKDVAAIRQDNWGKDWAVTKGFAAARGEFIRFLDSDDWLIPGASIG
jgi:glycosyltransferase involved in cell wall biosynthesis